jgi:hypothetical protein
MLSLRIFSSKLQSGQGFLFFFVGGLKILLLKISTLAIILQISEKIFEKIFGNSKRMCIFAL